MKINIILLTGLLFLGSCAALQNSGIKFPDMSTLPPTEGEVASGLKQALEFGANYASNNASATDGFFKNPLIRIPFPPEVQRAEKTLRDLGFNKLTDDFILSINRGAEQAARQAGPIFVSAIRQMTINDAWNILRGGENAATEFLKRTTTAELTNKFKPVITTSLNNVDATKYWGDITTNYNKIPFVTKINTDLNQYVTDMALAGLFQLVAQEEAKIRKDPLARTTDLLKKVFAAQ